jgi:hypothetical protein
VTKSSTNNQELPVFVIGFPRSGTTLLREEISAHPAFCIPPESSFMTWLLPAFFDWETDDCLGKKEDFIEAILRARKFKLWGISGGEIYKQIEAQTPSTYAELISLVYRIYCRKTGKPHAQWGDKNNVHGLHLREMLGLYPRARIIWVIRDPRDVWASVKRLAGQDPPNSQKGV